MSSSSLIEHFYTFERNIVNYIDKIHRIISYLYLVYSCEIRESQNEEIQKILLLCEIKFLNRINSKID